MSSDDVPVGARLAAAVAAIGPDDLPDEVVTHAKLCLLDTIGCGLHGSTQPQSSLVADMLVAAGGGGRSLLWGRTERLSAADAALVNGTSVHAFELDDLHPRSIVHPGSVVTTAALGAAADHPERTGREVLHALVIGYETAARVGMTMGAAHLVAGWHPTGTHGALGAATAAGTVLGLSDEMLAQAIGIAGTQSAGLMSAQYESMVKRFHAGRAAQSGVYAAYLAARGYVGIKDVFEAPYGGYLSVFAPHADPAPLTQGWGSEWQTLSVGFKPYSTNGSCHPSIDGLRQMIADEHLHAEQVERVDIAASTATVKHVGWPYVPDTVTTAQMNLPYIVAVVLSDGEAFVDQFTEVRIHDPALTAFAGRVHVAADPQIDAQGDGARHRTRLTVTLRDGRVLTDERAHAHGSAKDPMTEDEVRTKFRRLASTVLDDHTVARLEDVVDDLDALDDLAPLERLLSTEPSTPSGAQS